MTSLLPAPERLLLRLPDPARMAEPEALELVVGRVADDWLSARTDDRVGREGLLLGEPALSGVWEAFACPYLAWSAADGDVALLMEDLCPYLLPDVREPIGEDEEDRLLAAAAAMHAGFWESPARARVEWEWWVERLAAL